MRVPLTLLGALVIAAYAVLGAWLANDAAVAVGSGLPLAEAIAAMKAAGQPYSPLPGVLFAVSGLLLALTWAVCALHPKLRPSRSASIVQWAGILALGAVAYCYASFANLNSVGDTFHDWNADAVWRLEAPLYLVSAAGAAIAVGTLVLSQHAQLRRR